MRASKSPEVGERTQQLRELKNLLKRFKTRGFKNGDLVLTAQIHVVTDEAWGRNNSSNGMEVVTLFPVCQTCADAKLACQHSHIMDRGHGGQQAVMKLIN